MRKLNTTSKFLALAGLISAAILVLGPARLASAQVAAPSWSYAGNLNTARNRHTATLLQNGKVLVAGSYDEYSDYSALNSAELYDPATGTWSITGNLNRVGGDTATLLLNGKVLVVGGKSAELYDPATGTWSITGNLNTGGGAATLLTNGKVLVAGGKSAELYDPATGTWSITGNLNRAGGGAATLLTNGKVLVAWGKSAELYDPATGTWSSTGNLNAAHYDHTATLLPNGKVLVAGGYGSSAELYDPATGTWTSTGNLKTTRLFWHTATLLPSGKVLVAGGWGDGRYGYYALNSAELYDPTTGMWSDTASLNTGRTAHTMTLLPNGKVLVAGGLYNISDYETLNSAELYDPGTNSIDDPQFFVRQHYRDFLNREPEQRGLDDWMNFLNSCAAGDLVCLHEHRLTASADFFGSPEFKLKGYFVFRFYRLAFDRLPTYDEIAPDMQGVTGQTPGEVYQKKANFSNSFVQRAEFANSFGALSNANYVAALLNRYQLTGVTTPDPGNPDGTNKVTLSQFELVSRLDATTLTRAQVLRAIADSDEVLAAELNRAFVAMQYYGYLRRTPEVKGYNDWLNYLNDHPTDFREMVRGFVDSIEYRMRFGRP